MMISEEIKSAHLHISDISSKFLDYVKENPDTLVRANFPEMVNWHEKKVMLQCWPTFIGRDINQELEQASIHLFELFKIIPKRLFNNDATKISNYYGIPQDILGILMGATSDKHINNLMGRGDFIITPQGLKCIEFNVASDLGGLEKPILESLSMNSPLIKEFFEKNHIKKINRNSLELLLNHLLNMALETWGTVTSVNIAFVIPEFVDGEVRTIEKDYLEKVYRNVLTNRDGEKIKGSLSFCDFHHLNSNENGVYLNDKKVDILVELYGGIITPELLYHFNEGNLLVLNGPITRLLSNKLSMVLLSEGEDSDVFTDIEKSVIKKYIPWTRKLIPGNVSYKEKKYNLELLLSEQKDRFIIKPPDEYGGIGVKIGGKIDQAQWEASIEDAFEQGNWLVQEYCDSLPFLYQAGEKGCAEHNVVFGGFTFGSTYAGSWVRIIPKAHPLGVINRLQGCQEGITFEVDQ